MKKYINILIVAALVSTGSLASRNKTMSFTVSPAQLIAFSIDGKFTFKLDETFLMTFPAVLQVRPEIQAEYDSENYDVSSNHFSLGVGTQIALTGRSLGDGWYVEPRLILGYGSATIKGAHPFSSVFLRPSVLAGYKFVWNSGLTLNIGVGGYYNYAFSHEAPVISKVLNGLNATPAHVLTTIQGLTSGFAPTADFSIGYSW